MTRTRTAKSAPVMTSLRECGEMGLTTRRGLRARGCRVRWLRASLRASPCPHDPPDCRNSRVAARPRQRPDRRGGRRPVAEPRVAVPQADHRGGQIRHGLVNGEPVWADGVIEVRGDSVDQCMGGLVRDDVLREGAAHRDAPAPRLERRRTGDCPSPGDRRRWAGCRHLGRRDPASGKRPVDPAARQLESSTKPMARMTLPKTMALMKASSSSPVSRRSRVVGGSEPWAQGTVPAPGTLGTDVR